MLVFLLILLIAGLAGFGYWAYSQGYLKGIFGSDNTTRTSQGTPKNTAAPTIRDIQIVGTPALDGFIVSWWTDPGASSQVEYGPEGTFTGKTDIEKDAQTSQTLYPFFHSVIVKGLNQNTKYQYRVLSKTPDGVEAVSAINTVTTATDVTQ